MERVTIGEWVEYLISLQGSMKWAFEVNISEEEQENIRRAVNNKEDKERNHTRITDIKQGDMNGLYEVTTVDVITGLKSESKVKWVEDMNVIDLNNNMKSQDRENATQDDLLLLRPIRNKVDWNDLNNQDDDYDGTFEEEIESRAEQRENEMIIENNDKIQIREDGVKGRLKAMIAESFEEEHWDSTEMIGVCSEKSEANSFATSIIEDLNINEDLKFNLQQKIYEKDLQFQIILNHKRTKLTNEIELSIQKLIYLCERKKRSREIGVKIWDNKEKHDYQTWVLANFEADETNVLDIEKAISQSNCDEIEDDLSDEIIRNKIGISTPIFEIVEKKETLLTDIIPGSVKRVLNVTELGKVMKGRHFVITRERRKNGKYIKRVMSVENCEAAINEIMFDKMAQILNEAKIEKGLDQIESAKIDHSINDGPNSMLGKIWTANWVAFEGLDLNLTLKNKKLVIKELLKALLVYSEEEINKDLEFDERIEEGIESKRVSNEIGEHLNIIIIELKQPVFVTWEKGFIKFPNQKLQVLESKVNYIEKYPTSIRDLSYRNNSHGRPTEIDPMVITFLRDNEVEELKLGSKIVVVGGFTKTNGSIAMAERTNMAMLMACKGIEINGILDNRGYISGIPSIVCIFATIVRMIEKRLRPEIVMLIIARDFGNMKLIRDHILEIKETMTEDYFIVKQYGVKYYYVLTVEQAITFNETPNTYEDIRNLAIYNLHGDTDAQKVVSIIRRLTGIVVANVQLENQRNIKDDLYIDDKQRPKRAYAMLGNQVISITEQLVQSISIIMKQGTVYDRQILNMRNLPFWTTTYYFYMNEKKKSGDKKKINININQDLKSNIVHQTVHEKGKDKVTRSKDNKVKGKEHGKGRGGQAQKWGSKDSWRSSLTGLRSEGMISKARSSQQGDEVEMSTDTIEDGIKMSTDIEEEEIVSDQEVRMQDRKK